MKIGGGFGVVLLILLCTGFMNWNDIKKIDSYLKEYARWSDIDMISNEDVTQNLLKLGNLIELYTLKPNKEKEGKIHSKLEKTSEGIEEWKTAGKGIPQIEDTASKIKNTLAQIRGVASEYLPLAKKCTDKEVCSSQELTKMKELKESIHTLLDSASEVLDDTMERVIDPHKEELVKKVSSSDKNAANLSLMLAIIGLVVGVLFAFLITRGTTKPINRILNLIREIAKGNISKETIDQIETKGGDEIAEMAKALQEMLEGVVGEGVAVKKAIPAPFFITDKSLNITYANQHFAKMVGMNQDSIRGLYCGSLVKAGQCGTDKCLIRRALEARRTIRDEAVVEKDGRKLFFDVWAQVLTDLKGEVIGVLEIMIDITNQREAQTPIEENQGLMKEVAREVQDVANQVASASEELSAVLRRWPTEQKNSHNRQAKSPPQWKR
jgi:PAS domain S-box-containing protein